MSYPFYLMNVLMCYEYDWKPTEQEHQNTKGNEAIDGNDRVVQEHRPRTDSSKPHEDGNVEKHVYSGL
jgi:hypothetical protein